MPVNVFISYASEDREHLQHLKAHLRVLERNNTLRISDAECVLAGQSWKAVLQGYLETARIVILLVSASYIASDESYAQMEHAVKRAQEGKACVIPVLVRPCQWDELLVRHLYHLPEGEKPVTEWTNRDAAWKNVVDGIRKAIVELKRGETVSPMMVQNQGPDGAVPHPAPNHTTAHIIIQTPPADLPMAGGPVASSAAAHLHGKQNRGLPQRWMPMLGAALTIIIPLIFVVWYFVAPTNNPFESLGQPERGWIEAYATAIDSGDVDRILALHAIPTRYFFLVRNQDELQLRRHYQGWYDSNKNKRRVGFDHCSLVDIADDGSRALRCIAYGDPPFEPPPSRKPTCLVFTKDGKLLARTEISTSLPNCPPP